MATRAFHEIMTTRFWDLEPEALHAYRKTIFENIAARIPFQQPDERTDRPFLLSSASGFSERMYVGNYDRINNWYDTEKDDEIIAVIDVEGPVLRNGDACSYGSKEHKDIIMRAADDQRVLGIIVRMDSSGGSSQAKYDYQLAMEYAREKGKVLIGNIDGFAYSAGYAIVSPCDEIYFTNPHDGVGCIGTMCAAYTQKDGDVNTVTQERYMEVYADGSPYKNKEYREAAEGNYDSLRMELNKLTTDFQQMVRKYRPNVSDEQLTGLTYEAGDVIGSLVDGQGNFDFCVARVQQLASARRKAAQQSSANREKQVDLPPAEQKKQPESQEETTVGQPATDNQSTQTKKQETMAKNYPFIQSAAQVNSLVVEESGGFYMVETMADNVEAFCMKAKQTESTLAAKHTEVAQLNDTIEQLKKDHAVELETLKKDHEAQLTAMKETYQKEVDEKSEKLEKALKAIEEKDAEIKELSESTTTEPLPDEAPKDNNLGGAQEYKGFKVESVCDENLTWKEKAERRKQRDQQLKQARR